MEEWERDHPESTFTKVIENVENVIKTGKPFLEVIPDSPFPARSVVHGLALLLQLGAVRIILFLFLLQALMNLNKGNHECKKGSVRLYHASLDMVSYCRGIFSNLREKEVYGSGQKKSGRHTVGALLHRLNFCGT